jgi:hypothetical protein
MKNAQGARSGESAPSFEIDRGGRRWEREYLITEEVTSNVSAVYNLSELGKLVARRGVVEHKGARRSCRQRRGIVFCNSIHSNLHRTRRQISHGGDGGQLRLADKRFETAPTHRNESNSHPINVKHAKINCFIN